MELLLQVVQIVALLCVAALAIYAVVILVKVKDILSHVETEVKGVSVRVTPVLENMEVITSKLRSITDTVDEEVTIVKRSVETLQTVSSTIVDFEQRILDKIETPVLDVAGTIGSVISVAAKVLKRLRGG
ncbi:MAG: hypothetical protein KGJ59_12535 [Bacteroidota bacterium]|nr:hypothetical protein [Bacteroidota bacterium]